MPERELIKVLSIDGGGIRGIIPALVLAEIERQTKRPACELFDLIAGTSTGGIIALGVTVPAEEAKPDGRQTPRWSAADLAKMYVSEGPKIFHRSLLRTIETADGLLMEKYSAGALETALHTYMGETLLSQAIADVLITSYDIQKHEPCFFKSFHPRPRSGSSEPSAASNVPSQPTTNYPMRVVARATSAAPTYFEPEHVLLDPPPSNAPDASYALVDGGTFANNPAMCAYAEALRNNPGAEVLVVSLGTGRLTESISYAKAKDWGLVQWARPLLGVIMDGTSAAIDYQLDELLGPDVNHYRFQTILEGVSDKLDDVSPSNIAGLERLAAACIAENASRLATVCKRLVSD